jgi:hypothetical protein
VEEARVTGFLKRRDSGCELLRDAIEDLKDREAIPATLAQHMASCAECRAAVDELFESRALLSALPGQTDAGRPWFAARVMAAIDEQESKLEKSLEPWIVVPRLASRLAWVSALALLLSGSWLVERRSAVSTWMPTDLAGETYVDRHPVPVDNDDVLNNLGSRVGESAE